MDFELLAGLVEADRRAILSAAVRRRFGRHEVIFHEGDPGSTFHLIARGRVAIRVSSPGGDVVTTALLVAGEGFGEQALVDETEYRHATAVAVESTDTLVLTRAQFGELRVAHPTVNDLLIVQLVDQVQRLTTRHVDGLFLSADKRVLKQLLELDDRYGGGDITLTQDDLAMLAGTTRPTANRALRDAVAAGHIELSRGRMRVLDRDGLARHTR